MKYWASSLGEHNAERLHVAAIMPEATGFEENAASGLIDDALFLLGRRGPGE